jgi:hypothetical protein
MMKYKNISKIEATAGDDGFIHILVEDVDNPDNFAVMRTGAITALAIAQDIIDAVQKLGAI